MNVIYKIENWGNKHHPKLLDLIRMVLGALLFFKGIRYLNNAAFLQDLIIEDKLTKLSPDIIAALIIYVTYIQLVGGLFIFLGLITRLAAILQLPIVFGAIFFVNILSPFVNSELWLSLLALALLMLFIIIGSGPLSLDRVLSDFKIDEDKKSPLT